MVCRMALCATRVSLECLRRIGSSLDTPLPPLARLARESGRCCRFPQGLSNRRPIRARRGELWVRSSSLASQAGLRDGEWCRSRGRDPAGCCAKHSPTRAARIVLNGNHGRSASPKIHNLPRLDQMPDHRAHRHRRPRVRRIGWNVEDSRLEALDVFGRLLRLEREETVTDADVLAVLLQPADEDAFFHVPTEARDGDGDRH